MSYIKDIRKFVGHEPILTAGVVLFVFNDNDEILLQLRTDYNQYGFPGGSMELGESFEETAARELKEETNLIVDELVSIKVVSGKDTYREYPNGDKLYDITNMFLVKRYHGELKVNDDESRKFEWFNINDLPDNMTEHTKNYINKFGNVLEEALIKKNS
jgi:8-oxo-dGTP pyrophosphatase MutT (NUDIX family)